MWPQRVSLCSRSPCLFVMQSSRQHQALPDTLKAPTDSFVQARESVLSMTSIERQQLLILIEDLEGIPRVKKTRWNVPFPRRPGLPKSPHKKTDVEIPTIDVLYRTAFAHSLPFVGFGFLDNAIMIAAGDVIDAKICAWLGFSTLAAAGLGNLVSDVAGLGSAHYIEVLALKLGIRVPKLTHDQMELTRVRASVNIGRAIGISLGCLLGLFPLLFIGKEENPDLKHEDVAVQTQL